MASRTDLFTENNFFLDWSNKMNYPPKHSSVFDKVLANFVWVSCLIHLMRYTLPSEVMSILMVSVCIIFHTYILNGVHIINHFMYCRNCSDDWFGFIRISIHTVSCCALLESFQVYFMNIIALLFFCVCTGSQQKPQEHEEALAQTQREEALRRGVFFEEKWVDDEGFCFSFIKNIKYVYCYFVYSSVLVPFPIQALQPLRRMHRSWK